MIPLALLDGARKVGGFVLKHWTWVAAAGLGLALLISNGRLDHAKHDLTAARAALVDPMTKKTWQSEAVKRAADLGNCQAGLTTLGATIERQNASVAALGEASRQASARSTAALAAERSRTATAKGQALQIMQAHAGADACRSADDLILSSIERPK